MLVDLVAEGLPGLRRHRMQGRLDLLGQLDVVETTAAGADQMVVMVRQLLRDLEPPDTVRGGEAGHDPEGLEDAEVPVERALGPALVVAEELRDRQRPTGTEQPGDQCAAATRVPLPAASKAVGDERVRIVGHGSSVGEVVSGAGAAGTVRLGNAHGALRPPPDPEVPLLRSRTVRGALAAALTSVVLAGCASGPAGPLATVDGVEVPREQFEEWVRVATQANPNIDPVGLQVDLLGRLIQQRIIESILTDLGLTIDPALVASIREEIEERVGGPRALAAALAEIGFPQDYFDDIVVPLDAAVETLVLALVEGQTLDTRTARHILLSTAEEADEVFALLADGADFATLATERSLDPRSAAQGGDLGPEGRGLYLPEFEEAVWTAPLNTVLEPVATQAGFHVIEVTAAGPTAIADLPSERRMMFVGRDLEAVIMGALATAEITIDPTIGTWDPMSGSIQRS